MRYQQDHDERKVGLCPYAIFRRRDEAP